MFFSSSCCTLPVTTDPLGTIYAGLFNNYLYIATDWIVNNDSDPQIGGGNAWRFGTSDAQGLTNSGNSTWYEIYVEESGSDDIVMAREAANEGSLQSAPFFPGADWGFDAGSNFNGINWQYEVFFGADLFPPRPCNNLLPISYHWEWQQLDPAPGDGAWIPVYDGSVHAVPEPCSILLFGSGLAGLIGIGRKKIMKKG